jgi:hypothetical protein
VLALCKQAAYVPIRAGAGWCLRVPRVPTMVRDAAQAFAAQHTRSVRACGCAGALLSPRLRFCTAVGGAASDRPKCHAPNQQARPRPARRNRDARPLQAGAPCGVSAESSPARSGVQAWQTVGLRIGPCCRTPA